jgi:hypothetical protein
VRSSIAAEHVPSVFSVFGVLLVVRKGSAFLILRPLARLKGGRVSGTDVAHDAKEVVDMMVLLKTAAGLAAGLDVSLHKTSGHIHRVDAIIFALISTVVTRLFRHIRNFFLRNPKRDAVFTGQNLGILDKAIESPLVRLAISSLNDKRGLRIL